jgi:hypothetical protein
VVGSEDHLEKKQCGKKIEKRREPTRSGNLPPAPFDYPKDSLTEDKLIKDKLIKVKLIKGEVLKGKPRRTLTRPGRLRARSGSKLPAARFRSGPIETVGC